MGIYHLVVLTLNHLCELGCGGVVLWGFRAKVIRCFIPVWF